MQAKKSTEVNFSDRLKKLTSDRGLSQKEVAAACRVSDASASKWFNGGKVKAEHALTLAKLFGVSTEYLLGLDSDTRIRKASEYADAHGGSDRIMEEELKKHQAHDFHKLYLHEKARAEKLEKRLDRVHKGLIKMVEQLGGEE